MTGPRRGRAGGSRVGLPLLIVPAFVAWSRVAVDAHFVADILGSAALVVAVTWLFALAFRIDGRPGWRRLAEASGG